MFRALSRIRQAISAEECLEILNTQLRGVLSVIGDEGYPYGVPMDHYYCPDDGKIYFHSGMTGHKIDALRRCDKASYCVYDQGFRRPGEWALNIRSVVVFGRVEFIEAPEKICDIARRLCHRFTDDETYISEEIRRDAHRTLMFALIPEHMTGKIVNES